MKHCIALILAGGVGSRMKMAIPKQFAQVDGKTILQHTLTAFQRHPLIHGIYVVAAPEWHDTIQHQARESHISKLRECIASGSSSYASARSGILHLSHSLDDDTVVLIHDAVRPLISHDIISGNIATCLSCGNAITALASPESYMVLTDTATQTRGIASDSYIERDRILRAQTPHTFHLGELTQMIREAEQQGITGSQSIFTLANQLGHTPLYATQGDITNFKITLPTDILLFQAILHEMK